MRTHLPVIALGALTLVACGDREPPATAAGTASATQPASDGEVAAPVEPSGDELRRVCRAGLAAIHGQSLEAVTVDGVEGQIVAASWPAPVDGGRSRAECRIDSGLIAWKPVNRPVAEENRWMTQAMDPVVRFALDGDRITITQTLPDGTTGSQDYVLPSAQEAR